MDAPSTPMNSPLLPLVRKGNRNLQTPTVVKQDPKKAEKTFDELKKTVTPVAVRRPASTLEASKAPEAKRLREEDIEGLKDFLAEQKRRSELAAEQGEETTTYDAVADVGPDLDDWGEEDEEEDGDAEGVTSHLFQ